jgi:hypothetical protein
MRRRRPANLQGQARQTDLFASASGGNDPPLWRMLPEETRRVVTSLMARLILEHGLPDRRPPRAETIDDI